MTELDAIIQRWLSPLAHVPDQLYIVGGSVRDWLLSRPIADIDLMCPEPQSTAAELAAGRQGTVVAFTKNRQRPCYRVFDPRYPGNYLDLVPIHNGSVTADLVRRDFTINAMAVPVGSNGRLGALFDPMGGRRDLESGIIRETGPDSLRRDPLRIMRAFRIAAQLRFALDDAMLVKITAARDGLGDIAAERVRVELEKLFACRAIGPHVRLMDELGILDIVLPEIVAMKGCRQGGHHHLDVWRHSLAALDHCDTILAAPKEVLTTEAGETVEGLNTSGRAGLLKLAALLHDCAKPYCRSVDMVSDKIHFYGHDRVGGRMMNRLCKRLAFSNSDRQFLVTMVAEHLHTLFLSQSRLRKTTLLRWFRRLGDDAVALIVLSLADRRATRGPAASQAQAMRHEAWAVETISAYEQHLKPILKAKALVDGNDLLHMGMMPGPEIGRILKTIREYQDSGRITDRGQALSLAQRLGKCPSSHPDMPGPANDPAS